MFTVASLDQKFYPDYVDSWDNWEFREYVLEHVEPDMRLLDIGAGAGSLPQFNFKDKAKFVAGIDPSPMVNTNPYLHEAVEGMAENLPWGDNEFDVVISGNVLEHLVEPEAVFKEIARVLKPGGVFLFKTPNRFHYMPLIAQLTPTSFHEYYNKLRGRPVEDTFPTMYRANSKRAVSALASTSGLEIEECNLVEGRPEYLRLHPIMYVFGIAYERLVNGFDMLANFRILLVGKIKKPT